MPEITKNQIRERIISPTKCAKYGTQPLKTSSGLQRVGCVLKKKWQKTKCSHMKKRGSRKKCSKWETQSLRINKKAPNPKIRKFRKEAKLLQQRARKHGLR